MTTCRLAHHKLAHLLLALLLLFAQQQAALHTLSHALAAASAKGKTAGPISLHCDACDLLAPLGASIGSAPFEFALEGPAPVAPASPGEVRAPRPPALAYRSRAPPALV